MLWRHVSNYYRATHIVHSAIYMQSRRVCASVWTCMEARRSSETSNFFVLNGLLDWIVSKLVIHCLLWNGSYRRLELAVTLVYIRHEKLTIARTVALVSPKWMFSPVTGATSFFCWFLLQPAVVTVVQCFFVTVRAATAYRNLFSRAEDNFF